MVQSGKFGIKKLIKSSGSLGIFDITSDSQIRVIIENAGPTNTVAVYGRIQGQNSYQLIDTVVGTSNKLIDVALFDFLELEVVAYDTLGSYIDIAGSGFTTTSGGSTVASNVTVTNFPNPQNVNVVNNAAVTTELSANTPTISNITLVNIGTEYNIILPVNTKRFSVRVRNGSAVVTLGFETSSTYLTIPRGCSYSDNTLMLQTGKRTLYLKSNVGNIVIECVSWV
jgi:hypothetical protein